VPKVNELRDQARDRVCGDHAEQDRHAGRWRLVRLVLQTAHHARIGEAASYEHLEHDPAPSDRSSARALERDHHAGDPHVQGYPAQPVYQQAVAHIRVPVRNGKDPEEDGHGIAARKAPKQTKHGRCLPYCGQGRHALTSPGISAMREGN
jgi:hypothetical protein